MSLRGAWTKMPGRRAAGRAAGAAAGRLAPRPDRSRDIVPLPNFLALNGVTADDVADGVVPLDHVDPDLPEVARVGLLGPEKIQLVTDGQAVVGADGDLDAIIVRDAGHLAVDLLRRGLALRGGVGV